MMYATLTNWILVVCWLAELCHILLFRDFNAAIVNTFNDVMGVLSLDRAPNTLCTSQNLLQST